MRYSMLVYLTNMGKTLLEAARYLHTAVDHSLREEVLENGRQMIVQIRLELERHRSDLRTQRPLDWLRDIEDAWGRDDDGKDLEDRLTYFVLYLPEELRYKVRAVFFAELGEKWDSMESVYEYMREDPRFDPVVVLTPYFREINRNGKLEKEVIYKDYLTPLGISFLQYDQYSLPEDCPDLAFISQPYESAAPREFWPEYIAKYTRLVYLSYGIIGAVFADSHKTLCQLPVFRYAWIVPGPSERFYHYYRKHAMNGGGNMVVTGLPKFDPVIRLTGKSEDVPEEWKPIVENRAVILWNTWYDPQRSSIAYFDAIIEWFKAHDDCALIWRMHPLTDTVTKMYYPPQYYDRLQQNIAAVKASSNMIIDENASYNPSFFCSNAMISDYSSMMFQYFVMDKPVLWIKRQGGIGPFNGKILTDEVIIDGSWMEEAINQDEIFGFMERIRNGEDRNADMRRAVLNRDLPLADGHCGERVCNALWDAMHEEDLGT